MLQSALKHRDVSLRTVLFVSILAEDPSDNPSKRLGVCHKRKYGGQLSRDFLWLELARRSFAFTFGLD